MHWVAGMVELAIFLELPAATEATEAGVGMELLVGLGCKATRHQALGQPMAAVPVLVQQIMVALAVQEWQIQSQDLLLANFQAVLIM